MIRMSSQVESVIREYKQLSKIPSISGGHLTRCAQNVTSLWSVRNLDRGKMTKFRKDYVLGKNLDVVSKAGFPVDVSNELLSAVSPGEHLRAVIREQGDAKESRKVFLEVWSSRVLLHSVDLQALDIHGEVYADSEFKTLEWSPDETALVYIAERKPPKSEPFIKRKPIKEDGSGNGEVPVQGEEHAYRQDWGEQLVGKHLSVIALFKLQSETVSILQGLPESMCPGQVRWSPDGASVVGVAWQTEPRRLGLIFCTNRPSVVFSLTLDGDCRIISEGHAVRSPRFVGNRLVWLQRDVGGPHHACHQINYATWPLQDKISTTTALEIVHEEVATSNPSVKFTGMYGLALPGRCEASDDRLVFSTPQRRTVRSYVLHLESKALVDISDQSFAGSITILDIQNDVILAARTNMATPGQLVVATLPALGSEQNIVWRCISEPAPVPQSLKSSLIEYLDLKHSNDDPVNKFNALYFAPKVTDGRKLPLIVWPHGGPHSNFVDAYSLEAALFNVMGYACLQINYRGSTGDGEASVDFLRSRVGTADVVDCKMAVDEAVKKFPVDPEKLCLFGGSHGGFLVTHLSGQYPEFFSSVVSRNPVIDVATMFNTTDIADWCAVEAGFEFTESGPASEEQMLAMRRVSPMAHVHRVRAPTALMLGAADKRVPYYQGLEYHRRLRANGCVTKLFLYDDNHSLSSISAEMDNLINSVLWFIKHSTGDK